MHKQNGNGGRANQEEVFECVNRTRRLLIDGIFSYRYRSQESYESSKDIDRSFLQTSHHAAGVVLGL